MRGVDEHETADIGPVARREHARDEPSVRMADEQVGRRFAGGQERAPQFVGGAAHRARQRPTTAPAEAGAVVRARARERRHARHHQGPAERRGRKRGVENDERAPIAGKDEVQRHIARVDYPAWRRVAAHAIILLFSASSARLFRRPGPDGRPGVVPRADAHQQTFWRAPSVVQGVAPVAGRRPVESAVMNHSGTAEPASVTSGLDAEPTDYSRPFRIAGRVGNNAFAYDRRGPAPTLYVPSLIAGTFDDVRPGGEVVFEEVDEQGVLRSCTGLAHLVRTSWRGVPTLIVDNHNHVFYFWFEAIAAGWLAPGATLVHVDQHRDTRVPPRPLPAGPHLPDVFRYANFVLDVGNYIPPARGAGMVGDALFVTGGRALDDRSRAGRANTILNIDLDFFAPEMGVDFDRARRFIDDHLASAALVTIATSPFFVDQELALDVLRKLTAD